MVPRGVIGMVSRDSECRSLVTPRWRRQTRVNRRHKVSGISLLLGIFADAFLTFSDSRAEDWEMVPRYVIVKVEDRGEVVLSGVEEGQRKEENGRTRGCGRYWGFFRSAGSLVRRAREAAGDFSCEGRHVCKFGG
jgi:hypothetical protein